jgi:hypothetical protein
MSLFQKPDTISTNTGITIVHCEKDKEIQPCNSCAGLSPNDLFGKIARKIKEKIKRE